MRVAVTGATGVIGRAAVDALVERGDEVRALTRNAERARATLGAAPEIHDWPDPQSAPPPQEAIGGADAVLHLLGEPVAQRWSEEAKRAIRDSRVRSTRQLVAALKSLTPDQRPHTLVSQSATGYYGSRGEEPLEESSAPGEDFLARVTMEWEQEALGAPDDVRVCLTRTGVVLSSTGGALAKMLPPFRLGVGGPVAGGRQYVPWIHLQDVVGGLLFCLDRSAVSGAINLTAPGPVTNAELSKKLGAVLHRPAVMPVPAFALKVLYGEMAKIVLGSQRVIPTHLLEQGYSFRHADLEEALRDVLGRA